MKRERKWMPKSRVEQRRSQIIEHGAATVGCGQIPSGRRNSIPQLSEVLPTVNCILQVTPPPLSSPHLMTAWCRNSGWVPSKNPERSPWFQSPFGFGWGFEGLKLRCSSTSPSVKSWRLHFLANVVPETTAPKHLLHVTLHLRVCFQGNQCKTQHLLNGENT